MSNVRAPYLREYRLPASRRRGWQRVSLYYVVTMAVLLAAYVMAARHDESVRRQSAPRPSADVVVLQSAPAGAVPFAEWERRQVEQLRYEFGGRR